jgi:hypothetical protein
MVDEIYVARHNHFKINFMYRVLDKDIIKSEIVPLFAFSKKRFLSNSSTRRNSKCGFL